MKTLVLSIAALVLLTACAEQEINRKGQKCLMISYNHEGYDHCGCLNHKGVHVYIPESKSSWNYVAADKLCLIYGINPADSTFTR